MKKFTILSMLIAVIITLLCCSSENINSINNESPKPTPYGIKNGEWLFREDLSDEFNSSTLDSTKWDLNAISWGAWIWDKTNVKTIDNNLSITMQYNPQILNDKQYYFTSGIASSTKKIIYGYFEAKVKACPTSPGVCPAFWLNGNAEEGNLRNSEIDIIELLQHEDKSIIDMNLHAKVMENGKLIYKRQAQYPDLCKNQWIAPWDPSDDYHIYACENRPDSIIWYIDGKQVAAKNNLYWHIPMQIIVSMGVRAPYRDKDDPSKPIAPIGEVQGFPTTMLVDYIRVWTKK